LHGEMLQPAFRAGKGKTAVIPFSGQWTSNGEVHRTLDSWRVTGV
jgi:hypothetical protein